MCVCVGGGNTGWVGGWVGESERGRGRGSRGHIGRAIC